MKVKVAFIDSAVNNNYLSALMNSRITISGNYIISNGKVTSNDALTNDLTHATLCSKVFCDNVSSNCELYFIHILDSVTQKTNLNNLLIALEWCKQEKIKLINLSIGTTLLEDLSELYEKISDITNNNIIIVAASSNDGKMTFPASFNNVIGVKALKNKYIKDGFIFESNTNDRIDVKCSVREEIIEFEDVFYKIYSSNSYATSIITAKICNYISRRIITIEDIRKRLQLDSNKANRDRHFRKQKKQYYQKISIPVIAILNHSDSNECSNDRYLTITKLLLFLYKQGYSGICLSDEFNTNFTEHIFSINEFNDAINRKTRDILKFYGNYCNTSFIIIDVKKKSLFKRMNIKSVDILLYSCELGYLENRKYNNIKKIYISNFKDSSTVFHDIYKSLINF